MGMEGLSGAPSGGGLSQTAGDVRYVQKATPLVAAPIVFSAGTIEFQDTPGNIVRYTDGVGLSLVSESSGFATTINAESASGNVTLLVPAVSGNQTLALRSNNLSVFAATTSAQLAALITNETGSGALVFGTAPVLATPTENGVKAAVSAQTADYTVTATDYIVTIDATGGNVTVTLPAASTSVGQMYRFKRLDGTGNAVTIARAGADTIDGATSVAMTAQYQSKDVACLTAATWGVF